MYHGWLKFGGVEIGNMERVSAYARAAGHSSSLTCHCDNLHLALGHAAYSDPVSDNAPWYEPSDPATGRFIGFYPLKVTGHRDSGYTARKTDLLRSGSVFAGPRYNARELKVTGIMFAEDDDAMDAGWAWLRYVLSEQKCQDDPGCDGRTLEFYAACPGDPVGAQALLNAHDFHRTMYRVEPTDPPHLIQELKPARGRAEVVSFVLTAGVPWVFRDTTTGTTTETITPSSFTHVACSPTLDAYDTFVADPTRPTVAKPPRPAVVSATDLTPPATWNRYTDTLPMMYAERLGVGVPIVAVNAATEALRMVRVRFYKNPGEIDPSLLDGCDFDGEFLISYVPANAQLIIDGIHSNITINTGVDIGVPAGNLVFGSDGRPLKWPTLDCHVPYVVHVDTATALGAAAVTVDVAVRL